MWSGQILINELTETFYIVQLLGEKRAKGDSISCVVWSVNQCLSCGKYSAVGAGGVTLVIHLTKSDMKMVSLQVDCSQGPLYVLAVKSE